MRLAILKYGLFKRCVLFQIKRWKVIANQLIDCQRVSSMERDGPENGENFKLGTLAYGEENSLNCRTIQ